jgi:transketolase
MSYRFDSLDARKLDETAYQIRQLSLEVITRAGWGHIGGSFSLAELLAVLYFHHLAVDPANPTDPLRDRLILSKAHGSPALYAALALRGFLDPERLATYCRIGGLDGHTSRTTPGIEYSGGSLGTGLGYSVGAALGLRLKERYAPRVHCIVGDAELNEGQVWEAAMAAAHYRLDNLVAVVDYNKVAAKGFTQELMGIEPLRAKWEAFGWIVQEVDGHNVADIAAALHRSRYIDVIGKPSCIIAHTVKGRAIREAEFNYHWHTHAPSKDVAPKFFREIAAAAHVQPDPGSAIVPPDADRGLRAVIEEDLA